MIVSMAEIGTSSMSCLSFTIKYTNNCDRQKQEKIRITIYLLQLVEITKSQKASCAHTDV